MHRRTVSVSSISRWHAHFRRAETKRGRHQTEMLNIAIRCHNTKVCLVQFIFFIDSSRKSIYIDDFYTCVSKKDGQLFARDKWFRNFFNVPKLARLSVQECVCWCFRGTLTKIRFATCHHRARRT